MITIYSVRYTLIEHKYRFALLTLFMKHTYQRVTMIRSMKNFQFYKRFAYHISLLRQFVSLHSQNNNNSTRGGGNDAVPSSVHGNNVWNSLKKKRGLGASGHSSKDGSGHGNDNLSMSMGMGLGMRRIVTATGSLSAMNLASGEPKGMFEKRSSETSS